MSSDSSNKKKNKSISFNDSAGGGGGGNVGTAAKVGSRRRMSEVVKANALSRQQREIRSLLAWSTKWLKQRNLAVKDVSELQDGVLLINLSQILFNTRCKYNVRPRVPHQKLENCGIFLAAVREQADVKLQSIDAIDIVSGKLKPIIVTLWNCLRSVLIRNLNEASASHSSAISSGAFFQNWDVNQVAQWAVCVAGGDASIADVFKRAGIDGAVLSHMNTSQSFHQLGLPQEIAQQLAAAVNQLSGTSENGKFADWQASAVRAWATGVLSSSTSGDEQKAENQQQISEILRLIDEAGIDGKVVTSWKSVDDVVSAISGISAEAAGKLLSSVYQSRHANVARFSNAGVQSWATVVLGDPALAAKLNEISGVELAGASDSSFFTALGLDQDASLALFSALESMRDAPMGQWDATTTAAFVAGMTGDPAIGRIVENAGLTGMQFSSCSAEELSRLSGIDDNAIIQKILVTRQTFEHASRLDLGSSTDDQAEEKSNSKTSVRANLLRWCSEIFSPGEAPQDFWTSWQDGTAMCTVVQHLCPDNNRINLEDLERGLDAGAKNLALAFEVAEAELDIPSFLQPEDLAPGIKPDEAAVINYISMLVSSTSNSAKRAAQVQKMQAALKAKAQQAEAARARLRREMEVRQQKQKQAYEQRQEELRQESALLKERLVQEQQAAQEQAKNLEEAQRQRELMEQKLKEDLAAAEAEAAAREERRQTQIAEAAAQAAAREAQLAAEVEAARVEHERVEQAKKELEASREAERVRAEEEQKRMNELLSSTGDKVASLEALVASLQSQLAAANKEIERERELAASELAAEKLKAAAQQRAAAAALEAARDEAAAAANAAEDELDATKAAAERESQRAKAELAAARQDAEQKQSAAKSVQLELEGKVNALNAQLEDSRRQTQEMSDAKDSMQAKYEAQLAAQAADAAARDKEASEQMTSLNSELYRLHKEHQEALDRARDDARQRFTGKARKRPNTHLRDRMGRSLSTKVLHAVRDQKSDTDFIKGMKPLRSFLMRRRPNALRHKLRFKPMHLTLHGDRLEYRDKATDSKPKGSFQLVQFDSANATSTIPGHFSFRLVPKDAHKHANIALELKSIEGQDPHDQNIRVWLHELSRRISMCRYLTMKEGGRLQGCRELLEYVCDDAATVLEVDDKLGVAVHQSLQVLKGALYARPNLMAIRLRNLQFTDATAELLGEIIKYNHVIEELDLTRNLITSKGAQSLAEALKINTSLRTIDLTNNDIGDEGLIALADAIPHHDHIEQIAVAGNSIGDSGAMALVSALLAPMHSRPSIDNSAGASHSRMRSATTGAGLLGVGRRDGGGGGGDGGAGDSSGGVNSKGSSGLSRRHRRWPNIDLSHNLCGDDTALAIAGLMERNDTLTCINLRNNLVGDQGLSALAGALRFSQVALIDIAKCQVSSKGIVALAAGLASSERTVEVDISDNTLVGHKGIAALVTGDVRLDFPRMAIRRVIEESDDKDAVEEVQEEEEQEEEKSPVVKLSTVEDVNDEAEEGDDEEPQEDDTPLQ